MWSYVQLNNATWCWHKVTHQSMLQPPRLIEAERNVASQYAESNYEIIKWLFASFWENEGINFWRWFKQALWYFTKPIRGLLSNDWHLPLLGGQHNCRQILQTTSVSDSAFALSSLSSLHSIQVHACDGTNVATQPQSWILADFESIPRHCWSFILLLNCYEIAKPRPSMYFVNSFDFFRVKGDTFVSKIVLVVVRTSRLAGFEIMTNFCDWLSASSQCSSAFSIAGRSSLSVSFSLEIAVPRTGSTIRQGRYLRSTQLQYLDASQSVPPSWTRGSLTRAKIISYRLRVAPAIRFGNMPRP